MALMRLCKHFTNCGKCSNICGQIKQLQPYCSDCLDIFYGIIDDFKIHLVPAKGLKYIGLAIPSVSPTYDINVDSPSFLPPEIWRIIFLRLSSREKIHVSRVSRNFYHIIKTIKRFDNRKKYCDNCKFEDSSLIYPNNRGMGKRFWCNRCDRFYSEKIENIQDDITEQIIEGLRRSIIGRHLDTFFIFDIPNYY